MTFDNGDLAIVNGSVNRNVEAGKTAVVGIQETPASSPPNSIDSAPTAQAPATGVLPALLILSVFFKSSSHYSARSKKNAELEQDRRRRVNISLPELPLFFKPTDT